MEPHERAKYDYSGSGQLLPTPNNLELLLERIEKLERSVRETDEYFLNRMRND